MALGDIDSYNTVTINTDMQDKKEPIFSAKKKCKGGIYS